MEILTNAMPSYFSSMPNASMALIKALMKFEAPVTYEKMFAGIDNAQVVVVTGEEDNVYFPGYVPGSGNPGGTPGESTTLSMKETGAVAKGQELRFQTPALPAGKYTFTLAHDPARAGGDADLYVRVGSAPTTTAYDCRPYKSGSNESCEVTLSADAVIHVSVFGYAAGESAFVLTGSGEASGGAPTGPQPWAGMDEQGTVAKNQEVRFQTSTVPAGKYVFAMSGDGDADLYVRVGGAPTTSSYDCRPYKNGSAEECVMNLTTPGELHVMIRGYAASSAFRLVGAAQ